MLVMKFVPEDFVVKELPPKIEPGAYSLFVLRKRNLTTQAAIGIVARKLNIDPKSIGYAGNKDKNAVTEQLVSIRNISRKRAEDIDTDLVKLTYYSSSSRPLLIGDLEGNTFIITLRNLTQKEASSIKNRIKVPNLFGPQRFSSSNAEIGHYIVKKDFKRAAEKIMENDNEYGPRLKSYLDSHPNDYVNAIKLIPHSTLKMYPHALQSSIWNNVVSKCIVQNILRDEIPLVGFGTEVPDDDLGKIITETLEKHRVAPRDFIIKEIPFISSEGGSRKMLIEVDIEISEVSDDEFYKGRKKAVIGFSLPKSSYATVVARHILASHPQLHL